MAPGSAVLLRRFQSPRPLRPKRGVRSSREYRAAIRQRGPYWRWRVGPCSCAFSSVRVHGVRVLRKLTASHLPFRFRIGIDECARCETRRPDDRLRPCVSEIRKIGALDVLILHLKNARLRPATSLSEFDLADNGLERAIARELCQPCILHQPRSRAGLLDNLHLGVGLRGDVVTKRIRTAFAASD